MPQTYSFLSPETFETLVEGYINQLHIRKRNKALITQQLANDCLMVLTNPENTAIFNPKFRWWVRKHFVFTVVGELRILLDKKNGKPVCVREQLYDKVCYFHHIIGHGGRDKTFAAVRFFVFIFCCVICLSSLNHGSVLRLPSPASFALASHPSTLLSPLLLFVHLYLLYALSFPFFHLLRPVSDPLLPSHLCHAAPFSLSLTHTLSILLSLRLVNFLVNPFSLSLLYFFLHLCGVVFSLLTMVIM